jgi:uncharacterized protein (DUF1015 family)
VAHVFPFEGLLYDPAVAGSLELVTAPPYDVISEERRERFLQGSEYNVVHLDLAEGSPDPQHPSSRYARAAELLEGWVRSGALVRSSEPAYYAYEMRFQLDGRSRTITGLICGMELEEWGGDVIPHERTMDGPVQDRLALLRATATHMSPVYATVEGPIPNLASLLDKGVSTPPICALADEQGVEHRLWKLEAGFDPADLLKDARALIADGHHRYATALRYRKERDEAEGPGPWDGLLTFLVDAGTQEVPVLPFHRVQASGETARLGPQVPSLEDVLDQLSDESLIVGLAARSGDGVEYSVMKLNGSPPAVRALHEQILDRSVSDGALRFVPDAREADAAVRSGDAVAAWFLPATTPERIRAVVETGQRLPQKSTYFWPKPRTGMIMMPLDPN